jgi:hypothetical protein
MSSESNRSKRAPVGTFGEAIVEGPGWGLGISSSDEKSMSKISSDGPGGLSLGANFVLVTDGFGMGQIVFWILACNNGCPKLSLRIGFDAGIDSFGTGANGFKVVVGTCGCSGFSCFTAFGQSGGSGGRATGPARVTER